MALAGAAALAGTAARVIKFGFQLDIAQAVSASRSFSANLKQLGFTTAAFLGGSVTALIAIASGVASTTRELVGLQTAMARVHILMDEGIGRSINQLTADVRDFARANARSLLEVAQTTEEIFSVGWNDDVDLLLETSNTLAHAIGVTQDQAVQLILGSLNAYNQEASESVKVIDQLTAVIDDGALSGEDLATSFGYIIGSAAQGRVELEQWGGALASLTVFLGGNPATATTQLNQLFVQLNNSTSEAGRAFQEVWGVTFPKYMEENEDKAFALLQGLKGLREEIDAQGLVASDVFGRAGSAAAFGLLTDEGNYERALATTKNVTESAGLAAVSANKVYDTLEYRWALARSKLAAVWDDFSTKYVLPALEIMTDALEWFIRRVDDLGNLITAIPRTLKNAFTDAVAFIGALEFNWEELLPFTGDVRDFITVDWDEYATRLEDNLALPLKDAADRVVTLRAEMRELARQMSTLDADDPLRDSFLATLVAVSEELTNLTNDYDFSEAEIRDYIETQDKANIVLEETQTVVEDVADATGGLEERLTEAELAWQKSSEAAERYWKTLSSVYYWSLRFKIPSPEEEFGGDQFGPVPGQRFDQAWFDSLFPDSGSGGGGGSTTPRTPRKTAAELREERRQQSIPGIVSAWHALVRQFFGDDSNANATLWDFKKFAREEWSADYQISRAQSDVAGKWTPYGLQTTGRGQDFFGGGVGQAFLPVFHEEQQKAIDRVNEEARKAREEANRLADQDFQRVKAAEDQRRETERRETLELAQAQAAQSRAAQAELERRALGAAQFIFVELEKIMTANEGYAKTYSERAVRDFLEAFGTQFSDHLGVRDIWDKVMANLGILVEDANDLAELQNAIGEYFGILPQHSDSAAGAAAGKFSGFLGATGFGGFGPPTAALSIIGGIANQAVSELECDLAARQDKMIRLLEEANRQRRMLGRGDVTVNTVGVGHQLASEIEMADRARAATV